MEANSAVTDLKRKYSDLKGKEIARSDDERDDQEKEAMATEEEEEEQQQQQHDKGFSLLSASSSSSSSSLAKRPRRMMALPEPSLRVGSQDAEQDEEEDQDEGDDLNGDLTRAAAAEEDDVQIIDPPLTAKVKTQKKRKRNNTGNNNNGDDGNDGDGVSLNPVFNSSKDVIRSMHAADDKYLWMVSIDKTRHFKELCKICASTFDEIVFFVRPNRDLYIQIRNQLVCVLLQASLGCNVWVGEASPTPTSASSASSPDGATEINQFIVPGQAMTSVLDRIQDSWIITLACLASAKDQILVVANKPGEVVRQACKRIKTIEIPGTVPLTFETLGKTWDSHRAKFVPINFDYKFQFVVEIEELKKFLGAGKITSDTAVVVTVCSTDADDPPRPLKKREVFSMLTFEMQVGNDEENLTLNYVHYQPELDANGDPIYDDDQANEAKQLTPLSSIDAKTIRIAESMPVHRSSYGRVLLAKVINSLSKGKVRIALEKDRAIAITYMLNNDDIADKILPEEDIPEYDYTPEFIDYVRAYVPPILVVDDQQSQASGTPGIRRDDDEEDDEDDEDDEA